MNLASIATVVGIILALLALCYAVYVHRHPPRRTRLAYQTARTVYFDEGHRVLPTQAAMTFDGRQVQRLARTTVVFWNAGTEVLRGEDIVETDPIRLSVPEGQLLSHRVVRTTNESTQIRLAIAEKSTLDIRYDYLNPGDGAVLELLHDGTMASVMGTAKGLKGGAEDQGTVRLIERADYRIWIMGRLLPIILVIVTLIVFWAVIDWKYDGEDTTTPALSIFLWLSAGMIASLGIEVVSNWWRIRRRHPSALSTPPNEKK